MLIAAIILLSVLIARIADVRSETQANMQQATNNMRNMLVQSQLGQLYQSGGSNSHFAGADQGWLQNGQNSEMPCSGSNCENFLPEGFTIPPNIKRLLPTAPSPPPGAPPAVRAQIYGPQPKRSDEPDDPSSRRNYPKSRYSWRDSACNSVGKCKLPGYEKPPLVIMSFDGFSREYLDRGIVKSLDYFSECGARAERVLPSYPSRTFPNHYTIVTGLYPESHLIVDNNVFDPSISPNLESMKNTKYKEFWGGDPIWSVYKRETGGIAYCFFYLGCTYNTTGYAPDIAPQFNPNVPFREIMNTVIEWLRAPKGQRPGVITAYFDQPDNIGHYHKSDDQVNKELSILDDDIDYFLTTLHDSGVLDCVNLAILSDHGMQKLDHIYYTDNMYPGVKGIVSAPGVVGRIYQNGTDKSPDALANSVSCKGDENYRTFTRETLPVRKHYAKTPRVGDVLLQGQPGTSFCVNPDQIDPWITNDHGYDFLTESMHTVFFARGPSIKQGVTLPAFQNIEYMNLWTELLNLKYIPNNGTIGALHDVLKNPPIVRPTKRILVPECPLSLKLPEYRSCGKCENYYEARSIGSSLLRCSLSDLKPPSVSSNSFCFMNYCNNTLITPLKQKEDSRFFMEQLSSDSFKSEESTCYFENTKYAYSNCSRVSKYRSGETTIHSIAVDNKTGIFLRFFFLFLLKNDLRFSELIGT
ncbi:hypothetical protein WR25_25338 isoform B [Diploscapter pachys]|uniref:Extracellular Endonuclease subunit A domain-containing protein n=1 Tax=Diploscapter pachys TaxID=2018661 RepID=A0A2A2JH55_9BILA|nr:hypothetical protein WR25_25338 isoform A [Diploscapter pachys]PAV61099.1 hypothetical protein WR25_25338 isoform B [Diploscapter pachys]